MRFVMTVQTYFIEISATGFMSYIATNSFFSQLVQAYSIGERLAAGLHSERCFDIPKRKALPVHRANRHCPIVMGVPGKLRNVACYLSIFVAFAYIVNSLYFVTKIVKLWYDKI